MTNGASATPGLTAAQIGEFERTGFLILKKVLSSETIDRLVSEGDRLIADPSTLGRQKQGSGQWNSIRNCMGKSAEARHLIAQPIVLAAVIDLMGPNLRITTSHLIYRYPDPPSSQEVKRIPDWHRDIPHVSTDLGFAETPRLQIKAAYCLSDLTAPHSGGTVVLPGSHLLKRRPSIRAGTDPQGAFEPTLDPGDCLLFENRVMHAGAYNRVGCIRKSLMLAYGFRWLAPADYRRQPEELRADMTEVERFLVGESLDTECEFVVGGAINPLVAFRRWRRSTTQREGIL